MAGLDTLTLRLGGAIPVSVLYLRSPYFLPIYKWKLVLLQLLADNVCKQLVLGA